jgi:hypothetical protein
VKPHEVLLEGLAPPTLPSQMIVVILRDDLVEETKIPAFNGGEESPYESLVLL